MIRIWMKIHLVSTNICNELSAHNAQQFLFILTRNDKIMLGFTFSGGDTTYNRYGARQPEVVMLTTTFWAVLQPTSIRNTMSQ